MNTMRADVVVSGWANWIATDKDGTVWEYENEPASGLEVWSVPGGRITNLYKGMPPKDWRLEIYSWK